jgi:hypothetical protein
MNLNYSFDHKNFNGSFTSREDDNVKLYLIEVDEAEHKEILDTPLSIVFSKTDNSYEQPHQENEKARELAGFISVAIEQFEKNKG